MSFSPQFTGKPDVDRNLVAISTAFNDAARRIADMPYVILKDVVINTSNTAINHGLRYTPTGIMPIRQDANAVIWTVSSGPSQVVMRASAQVTVNLMVF